jgi:regulator-associated protein of mTOR
MHIGFADGSVGVFDERVPIQGGRVHLSKDHVDWIVNIQLRHDVPELITAFVRGSVKFSDLRSMRTFRSLEVQKSSLTSLAVHPSAPLLACGK